MTGVVYRPYRTYPADSPSGLSAHILEEPGLRRCTIDLRRKHRMQGCKIPDVPCGLLDQHTGDRPDMTSESLRGTLQIRRRDSRSGCA